MENLIISIRIKRNNSYLMYIIISFLFLAKMIIFQKKMKIKFVPYATKSQICCATSINVYLKIINSKTIRTIEN